MMGLPNLFFNSSAANQHEAVKQTITILFGEQLCLQKNERLAQTEHAHNKDTLVRVPTILSFCCIVKIRSEGAK